MLVNIPAWLADVAVPGAYAGDTDTGNPSGLPNRLVVIHTAETPETSTAAENVNDWGAREQIGASWDFMIDDEAAHMAVPWPRTSWAAPGVNGEAWNLEHAGYAGQGAGWSDDYSTRMLHVSARLVAALCTRNPDGPIPIRLLTPAQVRAGAWGICGHDTITAAYPEFGTGHNDPGPAFPWDTYLHLVRDYAAGHDEGEDMPLTENDLNAIAGRVLTATMQTNAGALSLADLTVGAYQLCHQHAGQLAGLSEIVAQISRGANTIDQTAVDTAVKTAVDRALSGLHVESTISSGGQ